MRLSIRLRASAILAIAAAAVADSQLPRRRARPTIRVGHAPGGSARQRRRQAGASLRDRPAARTRSRSSRTTSSSRSRFSGARTSRCRWALVIDNSGSMRDKRTKVEAAALAAGQGVQPAGRSLHRQLQRRGLPRRALHQRHQENGRRRWRASIRAAARPCAMPFRACHRLREGRRPSTTRR